MLAAVSRCPAADWQSLTGNSPFGANAPVTPATAPEDLEFRGAVQEDGVYLINLFNRVTKTSQWVPVKGQVPGLEVRSYDVNTDKVEVTQGGRPLTLSLKQARVNLVQPVAPLPTAGNGPDGNAGDRAGDGREGPRPRQVQGNAGGENSPMVRNLPPEAQAMIQEFRRRRAERSNPQLPQPQQQQPQSRPRQP
jgi:hypothetical protein